MTAFSRRRVLSLVGAGLGGLAGCTGSTRSGRSYQDTLVLNEDASARFKHRTPEPTRLSYELRVREGAPIDVFLIGPDAGPGDWDDAIVDRGSRPNVREADVTVDLPAGEWLIVVENGSRGATLPPTPYINDRVELQFAYSFE